MIARRCVQMKLKKLGKLAMTLATEVIVVVIRGR
jgi:hypothetical protein